jgi:hypothetical protein
MYVTLNAPLALAKLYHTVVHLACSVEGAANNDQAVAKTWTLFSGPAGVKTWDGAALKYYATSLGGNNYTTSQLLVARDGQCGSFADLLKDAFEANGVTGISLTTVLPPTGHYQFGVKNIGFGTPSYPSTPPYIYAQANLNIAVSGIPGQNTNPPLAKLFARHYIIHRGSGTEYYDPSYGVTTTDATAYSANFDAWQRTSDLHWRAASGTPTLYVVFQ